MKILVYLALLLAMALPAHAVGESLPALWEKATRLESEGHAVEAALACRRLLALDPGYAPARDLLAKIHTVLKLPPPAMDWRDRAAGFFPPDRLALGGSLCLWTGLFGVLATLLSPAWRRWRLPAFLFLPAGLAALAFSAAIDPRIARSRECVVTLPGGAPVYPAPSVDDNRTIARVPDGTPLSIRSHSGRWTAVTMPDGRNGWILSEALAPVVPAEQS
jgi:hypothetical protein